MNIQTLRWQLRFFTRLQTSDEIIKEMQQALASLAFQFIRPGTNNLAPAALVCNWCNDPKRRLNPACPYHGKEARRIIRG